MNEYDADPDDFSLIVGGPLYQFYRRTGLLRPATGRVVRRMVVITTLAWVPLLLLNLRQTPAEVSISFLHDISVHVRFLVGLPLLIGAEVVVHTRIRELVAQFPRQNIVPENERPRFVEYLESAIRWRNSIAAEALLLFLTIIVAAPLGRHYLSLRSGTWYASPLGDRWTLSPAGYWYMLVSLNILRFLMLRWYYRLFIWYRFLWQVSRGIQLQLNFLHPDRAGGLTFLSRSATAFAMVVLAHMVSLSSIWAMKIVYEGRTLTQFKYEIVASVAVLLLMVLAPLGFFTGRLVRLKRAGELEYSTFANRYVHEFGEKWLGTDSIERSLMGTPDLQSLADLSHSYQTVREMRLVPIEPRVVAGLAVVTLLPVVPLLLTILPLDRLLERAITIFF